MLLTCLVLLPYVAAVLCAALPGVSSSPVSTRVRNAAAWLAGLTALGGCALLGIAGSAILGGEVLRSSVPWFADVGLGFRMDGLAWAFGLIICGIGALVVLYARYYLSADDPPARFFALLLAFMGAMLGVVLADNLILLVVFWELTSLTSFLLIGFWTHRADARQGARMALTVTGMGGLCLLGGVIVLGRIVGSYSLDVVLGAGDQVRADPLYPLVLVLVLLGAFTKSAQFPFHFWLPHAMAAPTPVSAYLHSATMVKAGVFLLARLYPTLGGSELWFYMVSGTGLVTMTFGAAVAIFQQDLKGLLAYSTISHLGLITFLFGLDAPLAVVAGLFHILNHAAFKASLFMAAGIIDHESGSRDMRQLNGLWRFMPITATLAMVASAAMAGVPLLNGFLSKEMFFSETLDLDAHRLLETVVPVVATVAAALAVTYSVRFIHDVFFNGEPVGLPRTPHEPPRWLRVPVEILVVACLAVGIAPNWTVGPVLSAMVQGTLGMRPEYSLALWHGFNVPLLMSSIALGAGVVLYFGLQRYINLHSVTRLPVSGRHAFDAVVAALESWARSVVAMLPQASLPRNLAWTIGAAFLAMAWPLARFGFGTAPPAPPVESELPPVIGGLLWLLAVGAAVATTISHRRRIMALVLVGGAGLAVSLMFALFSAPDLALTQLLVEVATIALMMIVLHFLPQSSPEEAGRARKWRDALIAGAAGLGMGSVALAILTRPFSSISTFYLAKALPEGGGTNVVNVILVDFRGFDTLGEITVLGAAGLLVFALLAGFHVHRDHHGADLAENWNPLLVRSVTRVVLPLAALVSAFLFLRGHNLPGGGFIAGLVLACAILALRIGGGARAILDPAHLPYQPWVAAGLLVATLTGAGSMLLGYPFLTSASLHPVLPVLGEIPIASAALFDLGVFMTVIAATMLATMSPGLLPEDLDSGSGA
ncbi:MAG TPA: monovalent cation/H+ antiporter subunit A [Casimicrobiaceae bacterium]|nr:monovalent cation/H+ antiporter subunit A [Casimicrobiaceae bacterium]